MTQKLKGPSRWNTDGQTRAGAVSEQMNDRSSVAQERPSSLGDESPLPREHQPGPASGPEETPLGEAAGLVSEARPLWHQTDLTLPVHRETLGDPLPLMQALCAHL